MKTLQQIQYTLTSLGHSLFASGVAQSPIGFSFSQAASAQENHAGLADGQQTLKYGFIDKRGEVVISCHFENARDFSEGLAADKQDGKWGFIDEHGEIAIPCLFTDAHSFHEGMALVIQNGKN